MAEFEDKKKQKIQYLREYLADKEIEGCSFEPEMISRKKNEQIEKRPLDQFLDDQKRFLELRSQKVAELAEEQMLSTTSEMSKTWFMNEKSKKILSQK